MVGVELVVVGWFAAAAIAKLIDKVDSYLSDQHERRKDVRANLEELKSLLTVLHGVKADDIEVQRLQQLSGQLKRAVNHADEVLFSKSPTETYVKRLDVNDLKKVSDSFKTIVSNLPKHPPVASELRQTNRFLTGPLSGRDEAKAPAPAPAQRQWGPVEQLPLGPHEKTLSDHFLPAQAQQLTGPVVQQRGPHAILRSQAQQRRGSVEQQRGPRARTLPNTLWRSRAQQRRGSAEQQRGPHGKTPHAFWTRAQPSSSSFPSNWPPLYEYAYWDSRFPPNWPPLYEYAYWAE